MRKEWHLLLLSAVAALSITACTTGHQPVLTPPEVITQSQWVVPENIRNNASEGDIFNVVIELIINEQGVPQTAMVKQSSGNAELDQYALDNSKKMRFKPGKSDGKPVPSAAIVPLEFRIE